MSTFAKKFARTGCTSAWRAPEFDTLESLCYNFGTEPKEIKNYLFGHGFVYSEEQKQFRPIGYDSVTR